MMSEAEQTLQTIKINLKDNQYPAYDSIGVGRSIIKDIENIIQNKETTWVTNTMMRLWKE